MSEIHVGVEPILGMWVEVQISGSDSVMPHCRWLQHSTVSQNLQWGWGGHWSLMTMHKTPRLKLTLQEAEVANK